MAEINIKTGEKALIKRTLRDGGNINIIYSGMPTSESFALSPIISEAFLLDGFKLVPTIFYGKDSVKIQVLGQKFEVLMVNQEEIKLRI